MAVRQRPTLVAALVAVAMVVSVAAAFAANQAFRPDSSAAAGRPVRPSGATPLPSATPTLPAPPAATADPAETSRPSPRPATRAKKRNPADAAKARIASWISRNLLPEAPSYGAMFDIMANNLWRDGPPDILSFGDSMVQQGFEPHVLEGLVKRHSNRTIRAFNGASSRARWGVSLMLARWAARHHVLPKVALLGITTLSVNNDLFYKSTVRTTAFSALVDGCDRDWAARWRDRCIRQRSDLTYRFLRYPGLATAAKGLPMPTTARIKTTGWERRDGFVFHRSMTIRQVEEESARRVGSHFPGQPFVQDEARKQFRDLVALLRKHGVTVVAFSLPYSPAHQRNLDARYPGYEYRRQAAAADLAASAKVPLFQVARYGSWWGDHDSRDAIHLAKRGAASFTRQLWDMPGFARAIDAGLARTVRQ